MTSSSTKRALWLRPPCRRGVSIAVASAIATIRLAFAAGAQLPSRPPPPDTLRYSEFDGPAPIGLLRAWQDTDATLHFTLETHQRGLDTSWYTIVRTGPTGAPTELMFAEGDTAPNPGTRLLTIDDDSVRMFTPGARAVAVTAPFVDVSWEPRAGALALLAHVAHEHGDSIVPVTPSSPLLPPVPARVRLIMSRRVGAGANDVRIDLFGITIPPLGTQLVWVDDHGRLFADARCSVIRQGYEDDRATMLATVDSINAPAIAALAHALSAAPPGVAIIHATIVDVDSRTERPRVTVLVRGNRIVSVGPDGGAPIPADATVIDAAGKWLIPGLWDMDTHPGEGDQPGLRQALADGVTTVRSLGPGTVDPFAALQRSRRIDRGDEVGPRVINAGAIVDGPGAYSATTAAIVSDPETVSQWIDTFADSGFLQVNTDNSLAPGLVPGLIADAHRRGLRVGGRLPMGLPTLEAIQDGYDELSHIYVIIAGMLPDPSVDTRRDARVSGLDLRSAAVDVRSPAIAAVIAQLAAHHVAVEPAVCAAIGPSGMAPPSTGSPRGAVLALVGALHRAGVPLLAGTDDRCSLADELEDYEAAGIPAIDVLRIATLDAAASVHRDHDLGSIETGKLADLDLLAADPLLD
ncbi:MAG TPA: amidohydrolase family protein, partial [Gemmatimonadaceae bacterium]|nr:amidohydrolase family protein [Gemmatimonadaceae bacterium]